MRWKFLVFISFVLILSKPAAGNASDITGTYVINEPSIAVILQIIADNSGKITGHYEEAGFDKNQRYCLYNAEVTGETNGNSIILEIKPTFVLASAISLSGNIKGDILHVFGGGDGIIINGTLRRGTEQDFMTAAARIKVHASGIAAARRAAQQQRAAQAAALREQQARDAEKEGLRKQITQILKIMSTLSSGISKRAVQLENIEQKYRDITAAMTNGLERERSFYSPAPGQTGAIRAGIAVQLIQMNLEANNLHMMVVTHLNNVHYGQKNFTQLLHKVSDVCNRSFGSLWQNGSDLESGCKSVLDGATQAEKEIHADLEAYDREREIWNEEKTRQDQLIKASQAAASTSSS